MMAQAISGELHDETTKASMPNNNVGPSTSVPAARDVQQKSVQDALSTVSLSTLLSGAARLRQGRLAIEQLDSAVQNKDGAPQNTITFAALEELTQHYALRVNLLGLQQGECVAIIGVASFEALAAIIASLHAGLDVAILPPACHAREAASIARTLQAAALIGPVNFGAMNFARLLFDIAIECQNMRLITVFGAGKMDGAVNLDSGRNYTSSFPALPASKMGKIITTLPSGSSDEPCFAYHEQNALVMMALQIISALEINSSSAIVTPLMPCSLAGLVFGPVISLLSGASLYFINSSLNKALPRVVSLPEAVHFIVPAKLGAALLREPALLEMNAHSLVFTKTDFASAERQDTAHSQNKSHDQALFASLKSLCQTVDDRKNAAYPKSTQDLTSALSATAFESALTLAEFQNDTEKFTFLRYNLQNSVTQSTIMDDNKNSVKQADHKNAALSDGLQGDAVQGRVDDSDKTRWRAA